MIFVNGEPREREGATIAELLTELGVEAAARGVAVAVDGEVVRRAEWVTTPLAERQAVEVVRAVQGG